MFSPILHIYAKLKTDPASRCCNHYTPRPLSFSWPGHIGYRGSQGLIQQAPGCKTQRSKIKNPLLPEQRRPTILRPCTSDQHLSRHCAILRANNSAILGMTKLAVQAPSAYSSRFSETFWPNSRGMAGPIQNPWTYALGYPNPGSSLLRPCGVSSRRRRNGRPANCSPCVNFFAGLFNPHDRGGVYIGGLWKHQPMGRNMNDSQDHQAYRHSGRAPDTKCPSWIGAGMRQLGRVACSPVTNSH